ncbi:MAG: TolC family protein [Phycisphaerales bacterium]|jgi:outer membrane protein TolC|nr:TolC family protein [Phycisphaerales bacterium]
MMPNSVRAILTGVAAAMIGGCASPLDGGDSGLKPVAEALVEAELTQGGEPRLMLPGVETRIETTLAARREELDALTPATDANWLTPEGLGLDSEAVESVQVGRRSVVEAALANNIDLQLARLQPVISHESVVQAEAAFDLVLGAGTSRQHSKTPQQRAIVGNVPLGASESTRETWDFDGSLAKSLQSGGTVSLTTDLTRTSSDASGVTYDPNPAWSGVGTIGLDQPILRGFGRDVTLADIRLAGILEAQDVEALRASFQDVITDTESAWWNLAMQWRTLQVRLWLLEAGMTVADVLEIRRDYDTSPADYAQAVATVEQRRSDVIQQQQAVQDASDALKVLMNDPDLPLSGSSILRPSGLMEAGEISVSPRESIMTAMAHRPDLRQLAMSIDREAIDVEVADNAMLPALDLQAQLSFQGLDDSATGSYSEVFHTDYINYLVGLSFEYPIGNRGAKARYRQARQERAAAALKYSRGVQSAIAEVRDAIRSISTNAELVDVTRSYRVAQAESMRTLQVEEDLIANLTPTFLNLKLQTQAGLANARIAEFQAIADFNVAIADLYRATGTTLQMHQINLSSQP